MRLLLLIFLNLMVIDYATVVGQEIDWTIKMLRYLVNLYYITFPEDAFHVNRMKEKWDQKFPEYEDAISGEELRQYAIKLIEMASHQEKNMTYPWTPELNKRALRLYHQTRPHWRFHEKRMRDVWNRELPNLNADVNNLNLHNHALHLLGRLNRADGRMNFHWPKDIDDDVLKIFHETPQCGRKHSLIMKKMFDLKFPQFKDKVTVNSLRQRALRLFKQELKMRGEFVNKSRIFWDDQKNAEVIHIYHQTDPGSYFHEKKMQYCWAHMHPELKNWQSTKLRNRAKNLLSKGQQPSANYMESAKTKFDMVFPDGFKHKGKEIMLNEDQPSTSYSVHQPELEISQIHPDPMSQPEMPINQSHPHDTEHELVPIIGHFHSDDPIYSPVYHQEFLHDYDVHHQMASSSQLSQHFPNMTDYTSHHEQYSNSSQLHDQHHWN